MRAFYKGHITSQMRNGVWETSAQGIQLEKKGEFTQPCHQPQWSQFHLGSAGPIWASTLLNTLVQLFLTSNKGGY